MTRPQQAAAYGASAVTSPPTAANLFPYLPGGSQPYFAPQTSSPYIQRSAVTVGGGGKDEDFLTKAIGDLDISALSLSASATTRPTASVEKRDVHVAPLQQELQQQFQIQQQQQIHYQQRVGLPIFESFGARPSTAVAAAAASYPSRTTTGRHQYHPPPPPPTTSHSGVDRGEHEDIKVIHFGVV
jgi:hypothetical protein